MAESVIEGLASWELEALADINRLEIEADAPEAEASDKRWAQAESVVKLLDGGWHQQELADRWKRPDGTSYSQSHVAHVKKTWAVYHLSDNRPRWNEAYNSDEVRKASRSRLSTANPGQALPGSDLDARSPDGRLSLLAGDFRERLTELAPGSVDLILTDPPYPKEDLPLWYDLSQIASTLLGPRGLLIAYTGQIFLPEVLQFLSEHLTYGWTFALMLPGSGSRIMGRHMIQAWKPVVAFSTGTWPSDEWADDLLISPSREKGDYAWQQNAVPAQRLIERFTAPDGLVVDPFLGVGSFGVAARNAGRRFVGVELDGDRFDKARLVIL